MPLLRKCSAALTQTRPLSTATPNSAMNPTPAEMLNGMPRRARAKMPPEAAIGTARKISSASRTDLNDCMQQQEDHQQHERRDEHSRRLAVCRFSKSPPQRDAHSRSADEYCFATARWASCTKLATSRPRTLH